MKKAIRTKTDAIIGIFFITISILFLYSVFSAGFVSTRDPCWRHSTVFYASSGENCEAICSMINTGESRLASWSPYTKDCQCIYYAYSGCNGACGEVYVDDCTNIGNRADCMNSYYETEWCLPENPNSLPNSSELEQEEVPCQKAMASCEWHSNDTTAYCGERSQYASICLESTIDLFIDSVKPIQVLEDFDLEGDGDIDFVRGKPAIARVFVNLTGIENITADVKLEILNGNDVVWSETKINQTINSSYSLIDIKKGNNSVNFFIGGLSSGNYFFNATVDPENKIAEKNGSNNWNNASVEVREEYFQGAKDPHKLKIAFVPLRIKSEIMDWEDFDITNQRVFGSYVSSALNPLANVYPIGLNKIAPSVSFSNFPPVANREIYRNSQNFYNLYDSFVEWAALDNNADIYIGVTPPGWLIGAGPAGYTENGKKVALVDSLYDGLVVAHEVGHIYGLRTNVGPWSPPREEYQEFFPYGLLSDDGWCLKQDTGQSCGARINIDKDRTKIYEPSGVNPRFKYFCIMGKAGLATSWIEKEDYAKLFNKLVR